MAALIDRDTRVYVAGHRGLAGSAICRRLDAEGFANVVGASSAELDLRDRGQVFRFMSRVRPDVVVVAAARVGGILANNTRPAQFLSDNLQIQLNLMDAAVEFEVDRLLFLGSSCIYPKFAEQPIREGALLTGKLEPTNDAYAIAKIAGILHVQAVRRQYGRRWISAMPTNLYGPGDNFDARNSHVLPALIARFDEARRTAAPHVVLWGSGTPRREFLHVDDLADAVLFLLEHYDDPEPINVGTGVDISIRELADVVADIVGYSGRIMLDPSKPDGTPRKLLDVSRIHGLGWRHRIGLRDGIRSTREWLQANRAPVSV
jgi:GDP-L-fucose synthase